MKLKRIFGMLLICCIGIVTILFSTIYGPIDENVSTPTIEGTISYIPGFGDPIQQTFYYNDDYFMQSGEIDNNHLLSMSCNLALATFNYKNDKIVKSLFTQIGFDNIETADFDITDDRNTLGTAIASKKIGDKTIIGLAIRGNSYGSEWASNTTVGLIGNAKGFDDASHIALKRLKAYIEKYQLENVKIWIAGYSRAGGVANLMGVYLNNHLDEYKITKDDLYIYCFEAPQGCSSNTIYNNIYDVYNRNDFVTYVCPTEWNLHNNGKEIIIGEDIYIQTYYGINPTPYKKVLCDEFCKEFFEWLTTYATRELFVKNIQDPLSDLLDIVMAKSYDELLNMIDVIKEDVIDSIMNDNFKKLQAMSILVELLYDNREDKYHSVSEKVKTIFSKIKSSSRYDIIGDEFYDIIMNTIEPLITFFGPAIVLDNNYTVKEGDNTKTLGLYHFLTLANSLDMFFAHMPNLNFDYIKNLDNNY